MAHSSERHSCGQELARRSRGPAPAVGSEVGWDPTAAVDGDPQRRITTDEFVELMFEAQWVEAQWGDSTALRRNGRADDTVTSGR